MRLIFVALLLVSSVLWAKNEVLAEYTTLEPPADFDYMKAPNPFYKDWDHVQTTWALDDETKVLTVSKNITLADATAGVGVPDKFPDGTTKKKQVIMFTGEFVPQDPPRMVSIILTGDGAYVYAEPLLSSDIVGVPGQGGINNVDNIIAFGNLFINVDLDNPAGVSSYFSTLPKTAECNYYELATKSAVSGLLTSLENLYTYPEEGSDFFAEMGKRYDNIGRTFKMAKDELDRIKVLRLLNKGCPQ